MKQSSIEWLHAECSDLISKHLNGQLSARDLIVMHHNLYYDAKKMHKQEVTDFAQKWEDSMLHEYDSKQDMYDKTFNT